MSAYLNFFIIFFLIIIVILQILILSKQKKDSVDERTIRLYFDSLESKIVTALKDEMGRVREENNKISSQNRQEISQSILGMSDNINRQISSMANLQKNQIDMLTGRLLELLKTNSEGLEKIRESVELKLKHIQDDNNKKLEDIRSTVDEKLHNTLEKRLGESFTNISQRLEALYKQLGEMQSLSSGVNDLKKALTNVKVRGIWGEIQLSNIIEDILTKEQYDINIPTKKGSDDRVEFAIKLPGKDDYKKCVYLPIDAKFPQEDYQKLLEAQEIGDKDSIENARKHLERRIKDEAKTIYEKYIDPPNTTDFAILFLPTESLFAEVVRNSGLIEVLQREYKVIITGPTTIAALLNSLQMGFRTLAIEKRSSEVWRVLGAVKTEFGKFSELLDKTQKKLLEASSSIENASKKTRTIERKLKNVQVLPVEESNFLINEEINNESEE